MEDRFNDYFHAGSVVTAHRIVKISCYSLLLIAASGCCCGRSNQLQAPAIAPPLKATWWWDEMDAFELARSRASIRPTPGSSIALGEKAFALAQRLHAKGDQRAIDYWARTIAWIDDAHRRGGASSHPQSCRVSQVRRSAWIQILSHGQAYGRLDPASHLLVNGSVGTNLIPVVHQRFAWQPDDFDRLLVFESPREAAGNVDGRGVPMVVLTRKKSRGQWSNLMSDCIDQDHQEPADCDKFLGSQTPFAATALIHLPVSIFEQTVANDEAFYEGLHGAAVTFVNPLAVDPTIDSGGIAQSPAMPLIYARQESQYNPVAAFVNGDNGVDRSELRFLEPYQAEKIPLILVHGLISAPATFLEMADAVRADPMLRKRYQIWIFRYPTGDDFLGSAAELRQQLAEAFACQPGRACHQGVACPDRHSQRAVIVGHSLGGLLSKLQVTNSGDRLWRAVSDVPLEQLQGSEQDIADLRKLFFFDASPHIGRVVYIATPHQGSPWASRGIGRLATSLARGNESNQKAYEEIVANNPVVLSDSFSESLPSSIEVLRRSNRLLMSLAATPSSPDVIVNSVIGDSCRLPRAGPSDMVVPVESAYRAAAETTTIVDATHTSILRSHEAQQALLGILHQHLLTANIHRQDP